VQSPETNQSHQPVNPPVNKDAGENNERCSEEQRAENNPPGAEDSKARPAEKYPQPKKENGTQPEEQRRAKKRFSWVKRYRVQLVIISTVVSIVYGLTRLADLYISKRAYVWSGSMVSVLPGNEGIEIRLQNIGQTIIRRKVAQVWILPESTLVLLEGGLTTEFPASVTLPGDGFGVMVEWNRAPQEIPRIQNGELGMGFAVRIDYQDAFFIWHCEEVTIEYNSSYQEGFISTQGIPVCGTAIRSARYSRKCVVPYPDRVKTEWQGVWEWFPSSHGVEPPPRSNPVPCIRWGKRKPKE
jgi:hypothetical protein